MTETKTKQSSENEIFITGNIFMESRFELNFSFFFCQNISLFVVQRHETFVFFFFFNYYYHRIVRLIRHHYRYSLYIGTRMLNSN